MSPIFNGPKMSVQRLVSIAMLIALTLVISKFSIPVIPQQLVISFAFIGNTMIGMIAGPIWAFISLALVDVVNNLASGSGNFIIWWTLMEAVQGLLYGFFFYRKPLSTANKKDWVYVSMATIIIMLFGTFIFTPLLIQIYFHVPFWAQYAAGRWFKVFEIPLRVIITMVLVPALQRIPEIKKLNQA